MACRPGAHDLILGITGARCRACGQNFAKSDDAFPKPAPLSKVLRPLPELLARQRQLLIGLGQAGGELGELALSIAVYAAVGSASLSHTDPAGAEAMAELLAAGGLTEFARGKR